MKYTITMTDEERSALGKILKRMVDLLATATPIDQTINSDPPSEPARMLPPQDTERRILWASGKVDSEASPLIVKPSKLGFGPTRNGGECMYVTWGKPGATFMATVFDVGLFEPIKAALTNDKSIKLYLRKRGQYQNIVGVLVNENSPRA